MSDNREISRKMANCKVETDRLQSDGSSSDDSMQNMSITRSLEEFEASFDGAFDGTKIPSIFEVNEREDVAFKNAVTRSDKRFEMALGLNLLKKEYFVLKPVRYKTSIANLKSTLNRIDSKNYFFSSQIKSWNSRMIR